MLKRWPFLIIILCSIPIFLFFQISNKKEAGIPDISLDKQFINSEMSKIKKVISEQDFKIFLCEDGSVWSYGKNESGKLGLGRTKTEAIYPTQITKLEDIVNIYAIGSAVYALSSDGFVYGWGDNRYNMVSFLKNDSNSIIADPILLDGLSDIVEMDAKADKAFAVDSNGRLYCWGIIEPNNGLGYSGYMENVGDVVNFPYCNEEYFKDFGIVKKAVCGSGKYNYFIRTDGSVFSIMESVMISPYTPSILIFPRADTDEPYSSAEVKGIGKKNEVAYSVFYELKGITNVLNAAADEYTVFILKDNSVWYWDSNRIKYHDNSIALTRPDTYTEDIKGKFENIKFEGLNESDRIVEIVAGKENALFLSNNGQVWISYYETEKIEDVEYYINSTNPFRTEFTAILPDFHLKNIDFKILALEDVISISSDGNDGFIAVDISGCVFEISNKAGLTRIEEFIIQ